MTSPDETSRNWAALVPELCVSDLQISLGFYRDVLGFSERFSRPEDGFAYLQLGSAQIMIEQISDDPEAGWQTGTLSRPFGRGVNFQIEVADIAGLAERVSQAGLPYFRPMATRWYRDGDDEHGQTEFLVQDPDGYLLRFVQVIRIRPYSSA